jgi:prepilin-type N-terminal cleavage/methylation domain-containing protein
MFLFFLINKQLTHKTKKNIFSAFTLAEVLITLLIIGVVASLTIPAIIAETEKAETSTQVKKYQSVLQQAVLSIKNEYGSVLDSPLNSDEDYVNSWNTFKTHLNLVKDCGTTGSNCWGNGMYRYLNGDDWVNKNTDFGGKGILQDGSSIQFMARTYCSRNRSINLSGPLYNSNCTIVYIDVNGPKPPNQGGRDVFCWYINRNDTVYPLGSLDDIYGGCNKNSSDTAPNNDGAPGIGIGCTAKIIKEGKIDY